MQITEAVCGWQDSEVVRAVAKERRSRHGLCVSVRDARTDERHCRLQEPTPLQRG